jgi:hypothetical protein
MGLVGNTPGLSQCHQCSLHGTPTQAAIWAVAQPPRQCPTPKPGNGPATQAVSYTHPGKGPATQAVSYTHLGSVLHPTQAMVQPLRQCSTPTQAMA